MLLSRERGLVAHRPMVFGSFRAQALFGYIIAVLIPSMVGVAHAPAAPGAMVPLYNSLVGASVAFLGGLIALRRVTAFPGIRYFGYIIPSYLSSFGAVVAVMFVLRYNYSIVYLTNSFVLTLVYSYLIGFLIERYTTLSFKIVPVGHIGELLEIPNVDWQVLRAPDPLPANSPAVVADLRFDHAPEWERMIAGAAVSGIPVYHTKQLRESLTGTVSIEHLSENSFGSLLPNLAYTKIKRAADIVFCLLALPFVVLAVIAIGAIIRIDSAGPIFYCQERVGYRCKQFRMYKFRTMHPRTLANDIESARLDAMTKSGDNRITRIGRILRKLRLDELPQMLNVLLGDMSLIGPRPEAVPLSKWYESELAFYSYRHIVRPGITGWAQVNQGHVTDLSAANQKLCYDFYYIKNFSVWLDVLIALRTIPTMLSGFGSK